MQICINIFNYKMSIVSYSTLVQLDINSPSYGPVGTRITAVSLNTTQFD